MTFVNLNHIFFDFVQIAFWASVRAENGFAVPCNHKKVAFWLHPSRNLGWTRGRKWVPSAKRPLKTSISRPHQSRILGLSRGRKWLLSVIRPLESSLYRLKKVVFSVGQEAENSCIVTFDNFNHRFFLFTKSHFGLGQRSKISWECHASLWIIAFSTSPNSNFGLFERKKMFPVPGDHLKHRFLDNTKDEFWTCQEAPNDF